MIIITNLEVKIRKIIKNIDPGFAVVLAISFIAIWPFISRYSLPEGTDAELHIFRLAELSYLLRGGEIYPRWAPNFYHGYGYPIFNYYAPLTYYLGVLAELTARVDAVAAVKIVFILGMLIAGLGMYGFVRDNWGRRAGYVATAVFLYAPYVQYIDPHARGVLPESFSFGVFALALWAMDRLRRTGGRKPWLASVFLVAAVILSHNLMGFLFYGILSSWTLWLIVFGPGDYVDRLKTLRRLLPALILGLGIAAIFWLPVILERDAVNLTTLIGRQDNYDFHTHFLSVRELLSPTILLDWGATEPAFRFNLGIAQWLLGGLGLLLLIIGKVNQRRHLTFFALTLLFLIFLMLPWSTLIWENIIFLPFFQFPWRFLGAVAALLAILAGAGTASVCEIVCPKIIEKKLLPVPIRSTCGIWLTSAFILFPILLGLPLSQPPPWAPFGEVNQLRMTLIENTGRWLGTTSTADYVPATVDTIPKREASVVAPFAEGRPPDRVNWASLPEGTSVDTVVERPLLTRYYIDTPRDTRLRLFQFDFPGWQVRVDGQHVETELGRPEGFLVIPIQSGAHIVEVEFGSTPARNLALFISILSILLTCIIAFRLPRAVRHHHPAPFNDKAILALVFVFTVLSLMLLESTSYLHHNSNGLRVEPAQNSVFADFGEQLALLGYDISQENPKPGETIYLTLYWKAQEILGINYQVFVHVLGPDGLVAQSDKLNPGDFPTKRWPVDKYVRDEYAITIPNNLQPGIYEIAVGAWVQADGWRLPLLDEQGVQVSDRFTIQKFEIE